MKHKLERIAIGMLAAFIALSAIGGGIAMLLGTYQHGILVEAGTGAQFPVEWLRNTPFSDYTIPALVLAIFVGGSSLIATVMIFTGREVGVLASMAAGLIMAGYIAVEVVTLKQVPPGPTWVEGVYFGLGLVVFGLAASLWMAEDRRLHFHIRHGSHA